MVKEDYGIDMGKWIEILQDREVIKEKDLNLLKKVYSREGNKARASQLVKAMDVKSHEAINLQVGLLGKRIGDKLNLKPNKRKDGSYKWWNIIFNGTESNEGFYWILKPELKKTIEVLLHPEMKKTIQILND